MFDKYIRFLLFKIDEEKQQAIVRYIKERNENVEDVMFNDIYISMFGEDKIESTEIVIHIVSDSEDYLSAINKEVDDLVMSMDKELNLT